ncbi:MAG TPA: oligosaccharide flippase family protein [Cytophagaceae bacterium]|jgi:O-antigen/teichoic acid export membrane protein|nr:oligosaccharide flippase family protein [Cytophagaceae bacterium]
MGIVVKQSIKSTLVSYTGVLLGAFNVLWLYPKFLAPENIGLIRLLQDIPTLLAMFVQLGAFSIIDRYFHHFKDDPQERKSFLTVISLYPLAGYTLFVLSFFLFRSFWENIYASNSQLLVEHMIYLLPITFFMMYTSLMESLIRTNLNVVFAGFLREILIRALYTTFIFLYALKAVSFEQLIFLIATSYAICLVLLYIYAKRLDLLAFTLKLKLPPKEKLREIGMYVAFFIPGTAGSIIAHKIDTLMLGAISGTTQNEGLVNVAIYSLGYFIGSVVEIPRKSISQISIPILSKSFAENDLKTISTLYKKNSQIQLVTGIYIFSMIWINVDDLFVFIPQSEIYRSGKYVILFIGLSKLFDMATSINGEIIQFSNHYKFNVVAIGSLSAITAISCLIFIPIYKITGAAVALTLTIFLFNFIKTYFIWHKMKLSPFSAQMIPVSILCMVTLILSSLINRPVHTVYEAFGWILFNCTLFTIIFYFMIRKLKLSEDINNLIDMVLQFVTNKTGMKWVRKYL